MNCAKKAIIMAAGVGKRMQPVTLKKPKPLIRINGIRMIDTIIEGLLANDIDDIYIVVGYRKELFNALSDDYGKLKFIENPYYYNSNNISSLYAAREKLGDCIIIDGDQIIYNKNILNPKFERSGYCSLWVENQTKEWLQTVQNGVVTSCSVNGGKKGWQLFGISFWSHEDGQKLKEHAEKEFILNGNRDIYWDDLAMFYYPKDYKLGIRPISNGDIIEIDSFDELIKADSSYKNYNEGNN